MKDSVRHFVAEFVGTFALVFIGGGAIVASEITRSGSALLNVAVAHGVILALLVTATMRVSGHFNPAVTIAFMSVRRIEPMMAGLYIVAQLLAAILAAFAIKLLMPEAATTAVRMGGQSIALNVSLGQAIGIEAICTFLLTFVIFGTAVDPKAPKVGGFAIGLTVTAMILAVGPLTGASFNPARSLGPAVVTQIFEGQAAYWIGPMIGALLGAQVYERVLMKHGVEPVDHGAVRPVA